MTIRLSKFTPSLLDGEVLEQLYVERNDVLASIMGRVDEAGSKGGVGHVLVAGPRGAGKTHLISLVHSRTRTSDPDRHVSWLIEDPYDILSYEDLLRSVVDRCNPSLEPTGNTVEHYERAIASLDCPVLVLAENFDEILDQIGDLDQQRLRRLIESTAAVQLVATTTSLSKDLVDQPAPFYGFFNHVRLNPFTTDEQLEYLKKRAAVLDDAAFLERLDDPATADMARRRVQAIAHIAGGLPRVWALLSEGLTIEQLEGLVDHLLDNFDDITPYYQSQLRTLAPLQRQLVLTMVREDRALSAKSLAELIDKPATSVTKTLRDLADRGWVQEVESPLLEYVDGRITFYELTEPLLRLALDLKDTSQDEVATVLNFVKLWFDPVDLAESSNAYALRALREMTADTDDLASRWLRRLPTAETPTVRMLGEVFDAVIALQTGDAEPAFAMRTPLRRAVESQLSDLPELLLRLTGTARHVIDLDNRSEISRWLRRHEVLEPSQDWLRLHSQWLSADRQFSAAKVPRDQLDSPLAQMLCDFSAATIRWDDEQPDLYLRDLELFLRQYPTRVSLATKIEGDPNLGDIDIEDVLEMWDAASHQVEILGLARTTTRRCS